MIDALITFGKEAGSLPGQAILAIMLVVFGYANRAQFQKGQNDLIKVLNHHEDFVKEMRAERLAMNQERKAAYETLVHVQQESTKAMLSVAGSIDAMQRLLKPRRVRKTHAR